MLLSSGETLLGMFGYNKNKIEDEVLQRERQKVLQ
jgi:hypothetical protein